MTATATAAKTVAAAATADRAVFPTAADEDTNVKSLLSVLVIVALVPAALMAAAPRAKAVSAAPDIVLVVVDDMTEADWRSLPQTRNLLPASFPNYIHTNPLCCPSRASIFRGQYAHTHGTWFIANGSRGGWQSFRGEEDATIAVVLAAAGYRTGLIGKYLNWYRPSGGVPPGWDYWFALIDQEGEDGRYLSWRAVEGKRSRSYGNKAKHYSTDVFAAKSVAFITSAPTDQPLFAYIAPSAPHSPATVAHRYRGDCDTVRLGPRDKPSLNEPDMSDKPAYMRQKPIGLGVLTAYDRKRQCSLKAVDDLVVQVIAALEARGRSFDVVFVSDNGLLLGEHRRVGKGVPYEESIRTTMRAVGPDFPAGEDTRLIGNIDLAPTFAAIAGAPPRDDWDGRSILGNLGREIIGIEYGGGPGEDEDELAAAASRRIGPRGNTPAYSGFRSRSGITYVEYKRGGVELYDLATDPYQLENLAVGKSKSDFPEYHERLLELRRCQAAVCWAVEDAPLSRPAP